VATSPAGALKEQIAARTVTVVVGSGVSIGASGNAVTSSWAGLLRSGIERAASFNPRLPPGWKEHVLKELEYAERNDYIPDVLSAAEKVTVAFGGKEGGEFRAWLRDDIGSLELSNDTHGRELIAAIGALGVPIATTNYDRLIEAALTRATSTWMDPSDAQLIIQGTTNNILHLHGSWDEPRSIIFGSLSYGELMANRPAQAVERILSAGRSVLFIGCGAGLFDPNFESLRKWLAETFPDSELRHYRLCLEEELEQLARVHSEERIVPISYGSSHESLLSFLQSMAPLQDAVAKLEPASAPVAYDRAVEAIEARVRSETIMADYLLDIDVRALADILIPPVLLPVTQEQFVQSFTLDEQIRPKRCDPSREVRNHSCLLVAADETAGLTSALEWLVTEAHSVDRTVTPVVVDFRQLGAGHRPLERQIRKELRLAGVDLHPTARLPKLALGLDNLTVRPDKIFSRALDELTNDYYAFVVLGCRQGSEMAIRQRLGDVKIEPTLRYIGRLNSSDATKLATLIEPTRADRLASKAIDIAKTEHLPRTPLIIGLLICMLLRGETLLYTASPTALLDSWVNLLLGRGDPHDDARFSLDSLEKANILAFLAERFVTERVGSLSEPVALKCLEEYFTAVGWSEDPIDVLANFKKHYLLIVRNGQVRFAQSSYLHLFAAKRAIESEGFRHILYDDALYFSPILRHYAALTRNDADILVRVEQLLTPAEPSNPSANGSFSHVPEGDDNISEASIEDLLGELSLSGMDGEAPEEAAEEDGDTETDSSEWLDSWIDRLEESDREPFPLESIEDAEPITRVMIALTLASNVLRDSELVKDLPLKERVLHRSLILWGKLVSLLEADDAFRDFISSVAVEFAEALRLAKSRREEFVENFCDMAPILFGLTCISDSLSSRKLLLSLDACFTDSDFMNDAGGSVMGALLGFDIHEPGWTKYFTKTGQRHERIKAVRIILMKLAEYSYYHEPLDRHDEDRLLEFLVHLNVLRVRVRNAADRKNHEVSIAEQFRRNRILAKSQKRTVERGAISAQIESPEG
jgi:hypothetical protein